MAVVISLESSVLLVLLWLFVCINEAVMFLRAVSRVFHCESRALPCSPATAWLILFCMPSLFQASRLSRVGSLVVAQAVWLPDVSLCVVGFAGPSACDSNLVAEMRAPKLSRARSL